MVKTFKGALKSQVNHLKRIEVIGQGEILASQDFDRGRRLTYNVYVCDTVLLFEILESCLEQKTFVY